VRLLLDTHVFLWLDSGNERIPAQVREVCEDGANEVFLSLVSVWEIQIKTALGKMRPPVSPVEMVEAYLKTATLTLLSIELAHVRTLANLPPNHGDPFDRMLAAQARHEGLTLVTADQALRTYPIEVLWE